MKVKFWEKKPVSKEPKKKKSFAREWGDAILFAVVAASLLAALPLAVAHSRMPYHITPIPVMLVLYLWSLMRIVQNTPHSSAMA